jgi:hypothetical protein
VRRLAACRVHVHHTRLRAPRLVRRVGVVARCAGCLERHPLRAPPGLAQRPRAARTFHALRRRLVVLLRRPPQKGRLSAPTHVHPVRVSVRARAACAAQQQCGLSPGGGVFFFTVGEIVDAGFPLGTGVGVVRCGAIEVGGQQHRNPTAPRPRKQGKTDRRGGGGQARGTRGGSTRSVKRMMGTVRGLTRPGSRARAPDRWDPRHSRSNEAPGR